MNKYHVVLQGEIKGSFDFFFDAWFYAMLEAERYVLIFHPVEGEWIVRPAHSN